ncbi:MAG: hypothetical protein WCD11_24650, partial [Solirubrobacteraceae bacterium]
FWGYGQDFLDAARADLAIDENTIRHATIAPLDRAGRRIGFYGLIGRPPEGSSSGCSSNLR